MSAEDIDPKVFEAIVEAVSDRLRRAHVKLWQVDDGYDVLALLQPWKFGDVGEVDLHHLVLSVVESALSHIQPPITRTDSSDVPVGVCVSEKTKNGGTQ